MGLNFLALVFFYGLTHAGNHALKFQEKSMNYSTSTRTHYRYVLKEKKTAIFARVCTEKMSVY